MTRKCVFIRLPLEVFKHRLDIPPAVDIVAVCVRGGEAEVKLALTGDELPKRFACRGNQGPLEISVKTIADLAEVLEG